MTRVVAESENFIATEPMPMSMMECYFVSGSTPERNLYTAVGDYIMERLNDDPDRDVFDLIVQPDGVDPILRYKCVVYLPDQVRPV